MLIKKKFYVQKSFRVTDQVENDMALLAEATGRSQNEIFNASIAETLRDNKIYFLKYAILEHFLPAIGNAEDCEPFNLGGVKVTMAYDDGNNAVFDVAISQGEGEVHSYTESIDLFDDKKLKQFLTDLTNDIDPTSKDVHDYLDDRTDYSDCVKIRK